ncbi:hypothetical protein WR25_00265 [Diploscapter pachys]|uniref:TonB-dependent receptor-like beta-barrel domain-containing protein n=1 Tax=Diploscapter pachys TaxID=2018661 RepID=A0A2A2K2P3_9BILA|nr:hypothetical protein WR25_00265 [Diploscapter pachys]
MATTSYTDIFQPQDSQDSSGTPVRPIEGKNYEVGIKGEYFDGALNASLAVFRIDQENRAVEVNDKSVCRAGHVADGGRYRLEQGAYAVTDLMAGYAVNQHLDLQLNANNVFDRKYYSSISSSVNYGGDTFGDPRNLMLTAKRCVMPPPPIQARALVLQACTQRRCSARANVSSMNPSAPISSTIAISSE